MAQSDFNISHLGDFGVLRRFGGASPSSRSLRLRRLLLTILAASAPVVVSAHAIVISASPAPNSQVARGPLDIRVQLNSRIDIDRSKIVLRGPDGVEHPIAVSRYEHAGVLAAHANLQQPGTWNLRWQVLSIDGHITRGDIPFRVAGGEN